MGLSKQMTFTVMCALILAAVIPGAAGYLSGRLEVVERAERDLRTLETRLAADRKAWRGRLSERDKELRNTAAGPIPVTRCPARPERKRSPVQVTRELTESLLISQAPPHHFPGKQDEKLSRLPELDPDLGNWPFPGSGRPEGTARRAESAEDHVTRPHRPGGALPYLSPESDMEDLAPDGE
ncbi:hypothetical protein [Sinosporangium siamense]|uniref:Uncharacterized protein n=1 Tax=Sinosporangium siamense TaxID=1367973 RepID=A0A919VCZ9_9ACTN|nr:hypothetical protein [Sinosporangium siamense]GII93634.1 hypothetical protein Ssi02_38650 [Sinosporangium siamense]